MAFKFGVSNFSDIIPVDENICVCIHFIEIYFIYSEFGRSVISISKIVMDYGDDRIFFYWLAVIGDADGE